MSEEEVFILCLAVGGADRDVLPDSVIVKCGACGRDVWLSPSGVRLSVSRSAIATCPTCAFGKIKQAGKEFKGFEPLNEDQKEEILKELNKEER